MVPPPPPPICELIASPPPTTENWLCCVEILGNGHDLVYCKLVAPATSGWAMEAPTMAAVASEAGGTEPCCRDSAGIACFQYLQDIGRNYLYSCGFPRYVYRSRKCVIRNYRRATPCRFWISLMSAWVKLMLLETKMDVPRVSQIGQRMHC